MLSESPLVKNVQQVIVNIDNVNNLRGSKGENGVAMVKLEFNDRPLGESPKFEFNTDTPSVEVCYSAAITCHLDDMLVLDDLAYKPVIVTIVEVLPKEKKQKEEKVIVLGQVTLDLFPLVKGERKVDIEQNINPVPGSPLEAIPQDAKIPSIISVINVPECIVDENILKEANLMSITVESMYSTPEWNLNSNHMYTAAMPLPLNQDKEYPIVFANGHFKPNVEKEAPNKQKRWPNPAGAQGASAFIPNSFVKDISPETEDGDYRSKDDREHRQTSEIEKNRVIWNIERRCYLHSAAVGSFQERIAKNRYWPLEVFRATLPQAGKVKGKEEEGSISFHGVCYLNLAPLLYPGVQKIRGAYKVDAYTDADLFAKTNRKGGIMEEAAKIASNIVCRSTTSPWPKKGKEGDKPKESKKGAPKVDLSGEFDTSGPVNVEGQQYIENRSYVMVEIELMRPLVRKRTPDQVAKLIADIIPPRPMFPKRTDGAERAVADFHLQVANVASLILNEFRDMFGEQMKYDKLPTTEITETRRHKLIYELNSSGKYFAFKEQLKHSVIKIVREKYMKTTKFADKDELQAFLSELYVYLVDEMHVSLGRILATEDQPPIPEPIADDVQLKHFAVEAEENKDYDLASKYYQERIARNKNDAQAWYDYGIFCVYLNNLTKADECFRECISIDQQHLDGLLMYGIVCTIAEKFETAETFFEAATSQNPTSILAWTILGIFYDTSANDIRSEMAYQEAERLNKLSAIAEAKGDKPKIPVTATDSRRSSLTSAKSPRKTDFKDQPMQPPTIISDQGGLSGTIPEIAPPVDISIEPVTPIASNIKTKDSSEASVSRNDDKQLSAGKKDRGERRPSSAALAVRRMSRRPSAVSKESCPEPSPRVDSPVPKSSIYMKCLDWLVTNKAVPFTERCLAHELLAPLGGATCRYHIIYGRLQLQKEKYDEAETALNEAIKIDFKDPDSWAMVGHANFFKANYDMAKECYERTLAFEVDASDLHPVYMRLANIYLHEDSFKLAKDTYLRACIAKPSSVTWLGVGIACYRVASVTQCVWAVGSPGGPLVSPYRYVDYLEAFIIFIKDFVSDFRKLTTDSGKGDNTIIQ